MAHSNTIDCNRWSHCSRSKRFSKSTCQAYQCCFGWRNWSALSRWRIIKNDSNWRNWKISWKVSTSECQVITSKYVKSLRWSHGSDCANYRFRIKTWCWNVSKSSMNNWIMGSTNWFLFKSTSHSSSSHGWFVNGAISLSKNDILHSIKSCWKISTDNWQLIWRCSIGETTNSSSWLDVCNITSHIMTNSWVSIDCNDQLRLTFIGL